MKAKAERIARAQLTADMKQMIETSKKKNRDFTSAEREKYDAMIVEFDRLDAKINKLEAGPSLDEFPGAPEIGNGHWGGDMAETMRSGANLSYLGNSAEQVRQRIMSGVGVYNSANRNPLGNWVRRPDDDPQDSEHASAFRNYLRYGIDRLNDDQRTVMTRKYAPNNAGIMSVQNAQSTSPGSAGGYLVPTGFSNQLMEALKWFGGIEDSVDVFSTSTGQPLPWPTMNDTMNKGRIMGQSVQVSETDLTFNQVTFNAYIGCSDLVLVPLALVEDSFFDIEKLVATALGTRLGRLLNWKCTVGTGVTEPMGIVNGVVAVGNVMQLTAGNTASIAYSNLVDLEASVDPAYRYNPSTYWMFNDKMLSTLKKLTDGNQRPLWQPSISSSFREGAGIQDLIDTRPTILDHKYIINNDMSAPAASQYTVLFGDMATFKLRKVADGVSVVTLRERYMDYLQAGYLAWLRFDSQYVYAGQPSIMALQQSAT